MGRPYEKSVLSSDTPTLAYRRTMIHPPGELTKGLDALVYGAVGLYKRRGAAFRKLWRNAKRIDRMSSEFSHLSDARLKEYLDECRCKFRRTPQQPDKVLLGAVAALREAAERKSGLRPYRVQLMGILGLYHGYLIEMATGEGKTLAAAIAAILGGWTRRPCHVITVNDYLAQRDAQTFESLFHFCGVSVGYVIGEMEPPQRRQGYDQDVTYTTSKEILADFLRDRLRLGPLQDARRRHVQMLRSGRGSHMLDTLVMRGLHTAIVDEADSILIDEAVTPLIISQPNDEKPAADAYAAAGKASEQLLEGRDFKINHRYKEIELTKEGRRRTEELNPGLPGLWHASGRWRELIIQALHARRFFLKDQQYVLQEGKVVIVDEFTGRMMPMRMWRDGLHQAIEAKESVGISSPSETLSRLSFQRFFRLFHRLSGMTGTAKEASGEFWRIYGLPVIRIPTNRPCIRKVRRDRVFATAERKWEAVAGEVGRLHAMGIPVLVGTRSVEASEALAKRLRAEGLEFNLLNAVYHAEEARMVAEAGKLGKITIATNMAGRGTDIKIDADIVPLGGLHVIATERHEAGRIDRQLFGRSARQGGPGTAQAFISLDDNLFIRFTWGRISRGLLKMLVRTFIPGSRFMVGMLVRQCQATAQRQAYKQRQSVLKMDTWMEDALSFAVGAERITQ